MNRWVSFGIFLIVFASLFAGGSQEEAPPQEPYDFVIAHPAEPEILDPHFFRTPSSRRLWDALFEGLVAVDPRTSRGLPGLAENWEINPDGTIYTFRLRESSWQDGTPLTAGQVVASWQRILDPATQSPYAWYPVLFIRGAGEFLEGRIPWEGVGIRALDSRTVQVVLSGPYPFFINALTHQSFAVLPMHRVEEEEGWADLSRIVGNGGYAVQLPLSEGQIVLRKTSSLPYARQQSPERIIFSLTESPLQALDAYRQGQSDWLPSDLFPRLEIGDLDFREDFMAPSGLASYFYVFNLTRSPLTDPRVRRALSLAIDRDQLVEAVLRGSQVPAFSLVPDLPGYSALDPDPPGREARLEEAASLLVQAGYPEGEGVPELKLIYRESQGHGAVAEFLKEQWQQALGIRVVSSGLRSVAFYNDRRNGEFDLALAGWQGHYQDPSAFLHLFLTGETVFGGTYSSGTFDTMLVDSARMPDGDERHAALREAETLLCREETALLPLYFHTFPQLIDRSKWAGFHANPQDRHPFWNVRKIEESQP